MSIHFWGVLICTFLCKYVEASKISMEKLGFRNNYNGIVRELIKNWESPIVYLRQLGYLPSDYEDTSKIKPNLDALMSRIERDDQQQALQTEDTKSKEHFCGTIDTLQKHQKRENFVLQSKNKQKVNTERRQREVTGSQSVNYPTVVQLLAMSQHSKSLANAEPKANDLKLQQKPAEQKLMLLSRLLSRQQQEQVRPQIDASIDLLQRLVDKTSQSAGSIPQKTKPQVAAVSISKNNDNLFLSGAEAGGNPPIGPPAMQELLDNNAGKSALAIFASNSGSGMMSSMSMYGNLLKSNPKSAIHSPQFSRPDKAQSKVDNQPQIEAPQYLNWDIMNNRLKKVSTIAKNAHVNKLVQIFVKKQEALDI